MAIQSWRISRQSDDAKTTRIVTNFIVLAVAAGAVSPVVQAQEARDYLEEIIVTATKRPEPLQDVAVAVSAVTGDALEISGVEDVYSLQEQVPALTIGRSQNSTQATFGIRGIFTSSQNFGLESSVGLYVDGVYRARQSSVITNLVDIQQIEVLRGPQGTLFGKNTPSGAINMLTVSPAANDGRASNDVNAFVEATAGDLGLLNLSAASNIPLIEDTLALRATVFTAQRDGYVDDVALGGDIINDIDRWGTRLQLYYSPHDRLNLRVIADYSEIDEICCAALTRQDNIFAFGRTGPGGTPIPGTDFVLRTLFGGTTFTLADFENRVMALNQLPRATNEDSGLSLEFNYDFENVTLTSISAFRTFDTTDDIDADFSDVNMLRKLNTSEQSSFSQELRLAGTFGDRVSYVTGAYYFTQDLDADNTLSFGPSFADFFIGDCRLFETVPGFPPPTSAQGGLACLVDGIAVATAGVPPPPMGPGPLPPAADPFVNGGFAREIMLQDHSSWAVFGQFDFDLSDAFRLTVGLRYTKEDKDLGAQFLENALGPPPDLAAIAAESALFQANPGAYNPYTPSSLAAFGPIRTPGWGQYLLDVTAPQPDFVRTIDDDQVTGTIKLSWFANETTMFYVSYGTGYKSGGTNTDRINVLASPIFGPETSDAIEIGMKADFEAHRLNIALHDTQIDDLQANAFTGLGFNLQNAGEADTQGAEVEWWWNANDNFSLQATYTWTTADFENFNLGTCWVATPFHTGQPDPGQADPSLPFCTRSGDRVPGVPEHNFYIAPTIGFYVGQNTRLFIRPEYIYYSDTMTDGNNEPLKLRGSYDIWNLRVGLDFEAIDASLTAWGRNLADEPHYETVFDVPIQDGKLNAYPREPRTWGLTLRKNF